MLVIVDLLHVCVDFTALRCWDVSRGLLTLAHELLKEWVDFAVQGMSVKGTLHL